MPTAGLLAVLLASPAIAQENATLLLRSGQRVSGQLVDMGGVGFTIRVNGRDEKYRTNEVAVIDFAGNATNLPANELNGIGNGQAIVLNNGEVLRGTLYDIGGTRPLRLTVDLESGGRRDFRSNEVRRIYLARPSSSTTTAPSQPPVGGGVVVAATQRWVDTGITVRRGQMVTFNATGEIQLSRDGGDKATPDGSVRGRHPSGPMRNVLAGALIGRVGPVSMFGIGNQRVPLSMPAAGRLYLGVNDDVVTDNQGEFRVEVRPAP
jgi:hypothetical protein